MDDPLVPKVIKLCSDLADVCCFIPGGEDFLSVNKQMSAVSSTSHRDPKTRGFSFSSPLCPGNTTQVGGRMDGGMC